MKLFYIVFFFSYIVYPAQAVTTKMFKVLDTCARYRLGEIDSIDAIEKLKLKSPNPSNIEPKVLVSEYCSY